MKIFKQLILFMLLPFAMQSAQIADLNKLLFDGAEEGDIEKVISALENNANINAKCNKYNSMLSFYHRLVHTAPGNYKPTANYTALHIASYCNHVNIVKILLEKKANINALEDYQDTPLHWALHHGPNDSDHELILELLKNNADVNAESYRNDVFNYSTPLICAMKFSHSDTVFKLLINHGANISKEIFFFKWMMLSEMETIKRIFNLHDSRAKLTIAIISNNNVAALPLFYEKDIDKMIDFVDASNHTPLMHCAIRGNIQIIRELLIAANRFEFDFGCRNENGENAVALAQKFNKPEVVILLQQNANQIAKIIQDTSALPLPISRFIVQFLHGENIFSPIVIDYVKMNDKVNGESGCVIQ